jgi:hypothetical protein
MSTAQGNMADIVCDYEDFGLTVEVTMQGGQRQYETEGEPVTRHLNSTYTQVGVSCFYESEVLNPSSVLLMKFSAKNPHLRVAAKRSTEK